MRRELFLLLLPSKGPNGIHAFSQQSLLAKHPNARFFTTLDRGHDGLCGPKVLGLTTRGGGEFGDEGNHALVRERQVGDRALGKIGDNQNLSRAADAISYYLMWSPKMVYKAIFSGLFLGILHITAGSFLAETARKQSSIDIASGFVGSIILPLLSSACCSIQLIINALASAGGCAGFNTYLGPLRPYFFALLVYLTILSRPGLPFTRWITVSAFRFSLALLPEAVHIWNNYLTQKWTWKQPVAPLGQPQGQTIEAQIKLDIPTMGCVACINKIDSSIRATAPHQIVSSESWLDPAKTKGGSSSIRLSVSSEEEANIIAESIVQKVKGAGFETCRVESVLIGESTQL